MCHPEVPPGSRTPEVARQEVAVPVGGGETMPAMLATPDGGPAPAVLVVSDVYGRSPFYEDLAARIATAGFEALLPDFFFRVGGLAERTLEAARERRQRLDERRTLEDLRAALGWLRARPGFAGRLGAVGFCMGGTFVLHLAATEPDLATVCYYGFPAHRSPSGLPSPLDVAGRISGPVLGFWGDQDAGVGMDNVAELARRLGERGVDYRQRVYPGLGHGFLAASRFDESSEAYEAACESWTLALDLWRQHLRAAAPA
jgi:carboxymethylenebutenolidase